jgi:methyl-accepting chemotaxis protein
MGFFLNLSTRAKLLFSFGLLVVLMAIVSTVSYRDTERLIASQKALFQDDMSIAVDLMTLRNTINRERVALLSMAVVDAKDHPALIEDIKKEAAEVDGLTKQLADRTAGDPTFSSNLKALLDAHRALRAIQENDVLGAMRSGKRDDATKAMVGRMQAQFDKFRSIADDMGDRQLRQAEERMANAESLARAAQRTLVSVNIATLVIGLALVMWLDRIIAVPLKAATAVAQRIATGDLTTAVPAADRSDEVGELLRALALMVDAWKQMLKETSAGIVTLGAAADEILAGTTQASVGAAETAAAVSETTATVEEVKQTALLSSQKARVVSDAAQKAAQTAELGRAAIDDSIGGMESIQEQMGSIAETIVRLSERSQAIAEIIATVGGLAEQSNLLAVNAAIEAAKAGEQGKGFGVVAQEVKDLADQSKQATKQVRSILSDIQKAIGSAVMTTEQGSRAVASGVQQTSEAGKAIRMLADSIADAAQSAIQIAASSQQQLAGMDQVALAMESIKQVSAENAAGAKQSEASAQNLHELGRKLKQVSEQFKL